MNTAPAPHLNPAQQRMIDHGVLDSGFSTVLQMPTGSGKTWLAREAIRSSLSRGFRAVYLSPLRALADELSTSWTSVFPDSPVGVFTGDYGKPGKALPVSYFDARVMIMTPERLDACTRAWRSHWAWIPEVDWLVVDELHLLGDGQRGARLEGTISRFRRLNPFCRVLGLSATLGNRGQLADWLDGVELGSDWRQVPLEWKVVRYRKPDEKPGLLATEVTRIRDAGGQSLVFVQSRRRCEHLAKWLRDQGLQADHHHAGLTHDSRRKVEWGFRESATQVLVATGTLEMGINLPARQVILYDLQGFDGQGFTPLAVNTVWQRAGRAGRPGLDPVGEAVLFAPSWEKSADRYALGRFEPIISGLTEPQAMAEQILAEVHSGLARTTDQLERVFHSSLAAFQGKTLKIRRMVTEMLDAGMLREEERETRVILHATPLGRIACRHQLRPATVLHLRRLLEGKAALTDFDLLLACASAPDCELVLPMDFEDLENLAEELTRQTSRLLADPGHNHLSIGDKRLLAALKTCIVLWRWTVLGDEEMVAEEDGIYPFEISRLIESMDRLLLASASIQKLIDTPRLPEGVEPPVMDKQPKSASLLRIELLRQKVLNGIDGPAASLTLIDGIGSAWARKLSAGGIPDLAALARSSVETLTALPGLSAKRATKWISEASSADLQVPPPVDAPRVPTFPPDEDMPVDPYRLRRALDLKVAGYGRNRWSVAGGSEPRLVQLEGGVFSCNCPDHAKGRDCKHLIAVRLHRKDPELCRLVASFRFGQMPSHPYLDLFLLWFQR
ncbi:helicase-related protein [Luteolibacter flavescens]|uniref:Helicase-related protein n=1 Tax=Luteolibacter flavescens TaxID=1859460 RepID=A0ABT3FU10_9BACT|nr:DEAD/DEAH box helicase [Luteolibacter flavescens]MCW1886714.1 helicase-related protein [Luteolibacter flavescens]